MECFLSLPLILFLSFSFSLCRSQLTHFSSCSLTMDGVFPHLFIAQQLHKSYHYFSLLACVCACDTNRGDASMHSLWIKCLQLFKCNFMRKWKGNERTNIKRMNKRKTEVQTIDWFWCRNHWAVQWMRGTVNEARPGVCVCVYNVYMNKLIIEKESR